MEAGRTTGNVIVISSLLQTCQTVHRQVFLGALLHNYPCLDIKEL